MEVISSQSTSRSENEGIVASSLGERCTSIEQKVARIMGSQGEGVTGNRRALGFGRKTFRNLREVQEIMGKIANPPNFPLPTIKNPHEKESTSLYLFVRILQLQQIMQMILDTKKLQAYFSLSILFEDPGFHPFRPNFFCHKIQDSFSVLFLHLIQKQHFPFTSSSTLFLR